MINWISLAVFLTTLPSIFPENFWTFWLLWILSEWFSWPKPKDTKVKDQRPATSRSTYIHFTSFYIGILHHLTLAIFPVCICIKIVFIVWSVVGLPPGPQGHLFDRRLLCGDPSIPSSQCFILFQTFEIFVTFQGTHLSPPRNVSSRLKHLKTFSPFQANQGPIYPLHNVSSCSSWTKNQNSGLFLIILVLG